MDKKKKILVFGGTTEGRNVAEICTAAGIPCTVSVAEEYGARLLGEREGLTVQVGRLNEAGMMKIMKSDHYAFVVDATHPYADEAGSNIRSAAKETGIPCFRLSRALPSPESIGEDCVRYVSSPQEAALALKETEGNILLTTGVTDLAVYTEAGLSHRLFVRVLPREESIRDCEEQGLIGRQVIAMQGPFSDELNKGLIREFEIRFLVTKISGIEGGFEEKLRAAALEGVEVIAISPPKEENPEECVSIEELFEVISRELGVSFPPARVELKVIGAGGGSRSCLSERAVRVLNHVDMVFGSYRLLNLAGKGVQVYPFYTVERIADTLFREAAKPGRSLIRAAALFSGDIGFFSGAKNVVDGIRKQAVFKGIEVDTEVIPGVSSMALLSALSGISYDDCRVISHHGRICNVIREIAKHRKSFLLPSDVDDLKSICTELTEAGMGECLICVGFELSYENERVLRTTAAEFARSEETGLCCAYFLNDSPELLQITPGIPDDFFERGKAPMTREELRELVLCKLRIARKSILYDVGSGTGSIAVEAAMLSDSVRVFAIEKDEDSCELIRKNTEKARVNNVEIVQGLALDVLDRLPAPTHVFIGGSGGQMEEILRRILMKKNGALRVVLTAVTLETLSEVRELLFRLSHENEEYVAVSINRSKAVGRYHIMQAENMVYIISFDLL